MMNRGTFNQQRAFLNANFSPKHYFDDNEVCDGDDESGATVAQCFNHTPGKTKIVFRDGSKRIVDAPSTYPA